MKKTFFFSIFLFFLFSFLLCPFPVPAKANSTLPTIKIPELQISVPTLVKKFSQPNQCEPGKLCIAWIAEYLIAVYKYAVGIAGILASIVLMWGGVVWLTAGGNQQRVTEAQDWIKGSITGLAILFCSYLILFEINPDLVNLQLIKVNLVNPNTAEVLGGGGETPSDPKQRDKYDLDIKESAKKYGVDCTLVKAILFTESSGITTATSEKKAQGVMQMLPSTAAGLGCDVDRLNDASVSIDCGVKYIADLKKNGCNGNKTNSLGCDTSAMKYLIAAYNGGPLANGSTRQCPGLTMWECSTTDYYKETYPYVNKVISNYNTLITKGGSCS